MIKQFLFFIFTLFDSFAVAQADSVTTNDTLLFLNHGLRPIHSDPILTFPYNLYWPSILLFLVFIFYVYIKIADPKKIVKIFLSGFSLQASKQLIREDYKLYKRVSLFLSFNFILVFSFLLYLINDNRNTILQGKSEIYQYLFFVFVTVFVCVIKILITIGVSQVTSTTEIGKEYIFNFFVFCQIIGTISFPFIVFLQFSKYPSEWFLYPVVTICACFYILQLYRGLTISVLEQNIGILYIILYLCALEILPLLVLVKFLLTNF